MFEQNQGHKYQAHIMCVEFDYGFFLLSSGSGQSLISHLRESKNRRWYKISKAPTNLSLCGRIGYVF